MVDKAGVGRGVKLVWGGIVIGGGRCEICLGIRWEVLVRALGMNGEELVL